MATPSRTMVASSVSGKFMTVDLHDKLKQVLAVEVRNVRPDVQALRDDIANGVNVQALSKQAMQVCNLLQVVDLVILSRPRH